MTRWVYLAISILLTIVAFAGSTYVYLFHYEQLPAEVPIHWDIFGQPDSFVAREDVLPVLLSVPGMMALMVVLTLLFPWLSPRQFEVERFANAYAYIMALVIALLGYLQFVIVWGSIQKEFPLIRWLIGGFFLFFVLVGNRLGQVRRNFWMGVRTPWTLTSETVWIQTHRLAAWIFVIVGLAGLIGVFLGVPPVACFAILIASAVLPVIYSLVLYKRLQKEGKV